MSKDMLASTEHLPLKKTALCNFLNWKLPWWAATLINWQDEQNFQSQRTVELKKKVCTSLSGHYSQLNLLSHFLPQNVCSQYHHLVQVHCPLFTCWLNIIFFHRLDKLSAFALFSFPPSVSHLQLLFSEPWEHQCCLPQWDVRPYGHFVFSS